MLGSLIGAGASLLGGILGNKATEKASQKQYEQQKEFAQSGIQWKVKDAEAAGVHPLYALGANTVSYAPQSVGGPDFSFVSDAGQNIGRAIDATRSTPAKASAIQTTMQNLQVEGLALDNDLKRAEITAAIRNANPWGPAMPGLPGASDTNFMAGQGNSVTPLMHVAKQPEYTTNLRAFGKDYQPNPGYSNAQTYEDRYGELADYIAGPVIAGADFMHNIYYPRRKKLIDKMKADGRIRGYPR